MSQDGHPILTLDRHPDRLCGRRHWRRAGRNPRMCVPTAVLAFFVSRFLRRSSHSRWPAIVQAALVPLSIGLMGASGLILALAADRSWAAALVTSGAALLALSTRLNPLWLLAAGGLLGFAGLLG